jgi:hypothetical protein
MSPKLTPLLSQAHLRPTRGLGGSSNCSGPRTEMEIAYDKIPISNGCLQI